MLTVSRADIITDRILEYKDSFLKVPIDKYLGAIDVVPIPSQIALVNAVNNPKYRFICAALSRRQGKTYIANIIAQVCSLVPGSAILIMSPNYSLSSISFELQRGLISKFDLEVTKNNMKDRIIEMSNGSTIRMGSISQVDSCVGRSYDLILFDEAALTGAPGREAFNIALRPTLDKSNAKAIFISTPRGKNNWFSEFYQRGFSSEFPTWCSIHATWEENPRVSAEDIEEAKLTMSKAEFEQEYLASFNVFDGQIWQYTGCSETQASYLNYNPSEFDCIFGVDWGFRDHTAVIVALYSWKTKKFIVVDEYMENEKTTEQHARALQLLIDKWNPDIIYTDSAAQQTKFDLAMDYGISMTNAKKAKLEGISYVAGLFESGTVDICVECEHTLESVDQYQWDPREGLLVEKPLHNKASHCADGLRYLLYSFATGSVGVY